MSEKFMSFAINLAKRGIGTVAPNPSVGCVIVKNNTILSYGRTQNAGRPHAESIALSKCQPQGATMYVTLEPCCHHGETPPCTDSIIKKGIKKIFISTKDPDQRMSGNSIKLLQQSGIEVNYGLMEEKAKQINCGFFYTKILNRPFITVKVAATLDGKVASFSKKSKWITGENTRHWTHKLRSINDAILVTNKTFEIDKPRLSCRILGLEYSSPKKLILDNNLTLNSELIGDAQIITSKKTNNNNVIFIPEDKNKYINLKLMTTKLATIGITRLLIEGTNELLASLLKQNLVDQLIICRSNTIAGNDGIPISGDLKISDVNNFIAFKKVKTFDIDENTIEILQRNNPLI